MKTVFNVSPVFLICLLAFLCNLNSSADNIANLENPCAYILKDGRPVGTGFFITVPDNARDPKSAMSYFVTAKHVVDQQGLFGDVHSSLHLRVNFSNGEHATNSAFQLPLSGPKPWFQHEDPNVDLAVFPIMANWSDKIDSLAYMNMLETKSPLSGIAWRSLTPKYSNFATSNVLKLFNINIGCEVVTCGLVPCFEDAANPRGEQRNRILYRWGRISAIVEDNVNFYLGFPTRFMVLDCKVIPGNSGSPVFVRISEPNLLSPGNTHSGWYLLGVVSSKITEPINTALPPQSNGQIYMLQTLGNADFSVIVPVDYLDDILRSETVRAFRTAAEEFQKKKAVLLPKMQEIQKRMLEHGEIVAKEADAVKALGIEFDTLKLELERSMEPIQRK